MTIVYPGTTDTPAFDTFVVTTLPEDTPLSQAGPGGTRNLVESVEDQGDAIERLQTGAAYRDHDHSGDTGHIRKGGKLKQVNTHEEVDTDQGDTALHHTLGKGPYQAARGNHSHDYNNELELLNTPFKIVTSTTRPGNPTPGMMIYETDTKVFRQWELFDNNVVVTGVDALYNFDTPSAVGIGGGGWNISFSTGDFTHGQMITQDGELRWADASSWWVTSWARRNGSNAHTLTDDQVFTWKTGSRVIEPGFPGFHTASNDFYFRTSDDESSYIKLRVGDDWVGLYYTTTGRDGELPLGERHSLNTDIPGTVWRAEMVGRTFNIYRAGALLLTITDTAGVTNKGDDFKGYMIGMTAGDRPVGQTTPSSLDWFRVQDLVYYASTNRWTLLPLGKSPTVRLRQSKAQKLRSTGTIMEWAEELEDNFGFFNKTTSATDIIIREPGMYRVEAALQWDPQFAPDIAHVVVLINGVETTVRDSKFIRGSGFTPGFSQTLSLSAPIRLADGDVVTLKAYYTASSNLIDKIFSFFDINSRVNSRLDLTYTGV